MPKRLRFRSIQLISLMLIGSAPLLAQSLVNVRPAHSSAGAASFESNCAGCHGSDGGGGERAPDIARSTAVQQLSDSQLTRVISDGISGGGMPAFASLGADKVAAIVEYLRFLQGSETVLTLPGDPHVGEVLFFGNARCSTCHMVSGKGGFIAADLTFYGMDKSVDQIRNIIVDPDKYLSPQSKPITVVTLTGQKVTGLTRSNDNFFISLQTSNGSFHFFNKSCLKQIDVDPHSLMPSSEAFNLGNAKVNDLVSYVISVARVNAKRTPAQMPILNGRGVHVK